MFQLLKPRLRSLMLMSQQTVRHRHSMTNLYETLGCTQLSTHQDIENAYRHMAKFYIPKDGSEMDHAMKIFFDDLTMAYTTLISEDSRTEYDEYLSQN